MAADLTSAAFLSRTVTKEQEAFTHEARLVAEQAARIAANPPTVQRSVSGDLTRLSQEVAFLLRRAAKIEASLEALGLMEAETSTDRTTEK